MKSILFIFSGLPGTGKTTLAKEIAKHYKLPYFRLDTIEHGLKDICSINVQGEGYRLAYRIVSDNLKLGNNVVVDCCNPWELTRNEWEEVAVTNDSDYVNIQVICSDKQEHKLRVEKRQSDITGIKLPTWDEIQKREYHEWKKERIIIETSKKKIEDCISELINKINTSIRRFA